MTSLLGRVWRSALFSLSLSVAACDVAPAALDAGTASGDAAHVDAGDALTRDAASMIDTSVLLDAPPDPMFDAGEALDALPPEDAPPAMADAGATDDALRAMTDADSMPLDASLSMDDGGATPPDAPPPPTDAGAMPDAPVALVCPMGDALGAAIDRERVRLGITGAIGRFSMPGCEWTGASGVSDRATGRAVVPTDRYRVGSITKTFTAVVILQLMEEGRISLDDRLSSFVTFPGGDGITIRHLLSHTSGIYDYYGSPAVVADQSRPWARDEVIAVAAAQPPLFAPGANWAYSNTNYFLLGMVIERITGNAYHVEVRRRLLTPLGLDETYLEGPESLPGGLVVRSYEHRSGPYVDITALTHPSLGWSAGSYISTAEDMEDWGRAVFTGSVLSPATRALMLTPTALPGGRTGQTGLCIFVQNLGATLGTLYSHHGWFGGFRTVMGYLPAHDAMTVAFSNDDGGPANPLMTGMWMAAGLL